MILKLNLYFSSCLFILFPDQKFSNPFTGNIDGVIFTWNWPWYALSYIVRYYCWFCLYIVFQITGIAILALGIWMKVQLYMYVELTMIYYIFIANLVFLSLFQITGIAILALGIWMKVQLYMYMELTTIYYSEAPFVLMGTGALIVLVGSLACCCTAKGNACFLYLVS